MRVYNHPQDPAHCISCGEFTHGAICVYCFPKEAAAADAADDLRKKIAGLESQLNAVTNDYRDDEVDFESAAIAGDLRRTERELEEQLAKF